MQETCKQSDKMEAEYQEKINSKISQKFEVYEENRQTKLQSMRKRLRDHVSCPALAWLLASFFVTLGTVRWFGFVLFGFSYAGQLFHIDSVFDHSEDGYCREPQFLFYVSSIKVLFAEI